MNYKNLGLVKAIHKGVTAPSNTNILWYDTTTNLIKYYDSVGLVWKWLAAEATELPSNLLQYIIAETEIGEQNYLIPSLSNKTIIAVKMGQYFMDDTQYSFDTETFTLTDIPDGVFKVLILFS